MSIAPEEFDFDFERSRAAVAVSCLRWLRCNGPRDLDLDLDRLRDVPPMPPARVPGSILPSIDPPHPLWDRWLDG